LLTTIALTQPTRVEPLRGVCAGGLSAVPLLSTVFSNIITPQTDNHYPLRISKGLNPLRIQAI
jgi:hypothetical protein